MTPTTPLKSAVELLPKRHKLIMPSPLDPIALPIRKRGTGSIIYTILVDQQCGDMFAHQWYIAPKSHLPRTEATLRLPCGRADRATAYLNTILESKCPIDYHVGIPHHTPSFDKLAEGQISRVDLRFYPTPGMHHHSHQINACSECSAPAPLVCPFCSCSLCRTHFDDHVADCGEP